MSYNEHTLWIQFAYLILGILTSTFVGSVGFGIWLFLCKGTAKFHVKDAMKYLRLVIACFLVPVVPFALYPMLKIAVGFGGINMAKDTVDSFNVLLKVWIAFALLILFIRLVNYIVVCRLCGFNVPVEDELVLDEVQRWKETLHIRKRVNVYINYKVSSPAIFYHFGYVILLPAYEMDSKEMSMAVLHELVHLKHRDIWVKDLCFVINVLHIFNPLTKLLKSHIAKWAEVLCDLTVCEVGEGSFTKQEYYNSILNLMKRAEQNKHNDAMLAMFEKESLIQFRVEMFARANKQKKTALRCVFYIVLVFMIFVTFLTLNVSAQATAVWYENDLVETNGEEKMVKDEYQTMSYEEMFEGATVREIVLEEDGECIDDIYVIQKNEIIVLKTESGRKLRAVFTFLDGKEYVMGYFNGEEILYMQCSDTASVSFADSTEPEWFFLKNGNSKDMEVEVSILLD